MLSIHVRSAAHSFLQRVHAFYTCLTRCALHEPGDYGCEVGPGSRTGCSLHSSFESQATRNTVDR
jgi:hypothetical protein